MWCSQRSPDGEPLTLSTDTKAAALEERFDLVAVDPGEVAGDRMLDGAGGDAEVDGALQVALEHAVDEARGEGVAGAEAIDDLDLVRARASRLAPLVGD